MKSVYLSANKLNMFYLLTKIKLYKCVTCSINNDIFNINVKNIYKTYK